MIGSQKNPSTRTESYASRLYAHHPQLSLKGIFLHSSHSQALFFFFLCQFILNHLQEIIKNLTSPPPQTLISHFFFPLRFQIGHHKSVFPLALSSHFHTFPHYSLGQSGPMSTLFIIIMSHCASRRIRPSCCLTNNYFCLVQLLWLLPGFATLLCFALSQLSFSK